MPDAKRTRRPGGEWSSGHTPSSDNNYVEHARKHGVEVRIERVVKTTRVAHVKP